jgi:ankyrin repeat protein
MLLGSGADRNRKNKNGRTAAQVAKSNGHASALLAPTGAE